MEGLRMGKKRRTRSGEEVRALLIAADPAPPVSLVVPVLQRPPAFGYAIPVCKDDKVLSFVRALALDGMPDQGGCQIAGSGCRLDVA